MLRFLLSSRPSTKFTMCADGVTIVSSMLPVMMPARLGGVCGKPPFGAAGIVGGIVEMFTKRAAGFVSYAAPNGLLIDGRHPEGQVLVEVGGEPWPMRSKTLA
jgi:hypothetical protein